MPTISVFFGILISMYHDDHNPPHFHAKYNEHRVIIEIGTLRILDGKLPKRALAMVLEWANDHRRELEQNWKLAQEHEPLNKIAGLE
jgi:hypothetical protein